MPTNDRSRTLQDNVVPLDQVEELVDFALGLLRHQDAVIIFPSCAAVVSAIESGCAEQQDPS